MSTVEGAEPKASPGLDQDSKPSGPEPPEEAYRAAETFRGLVLGLMPKARVPAATRAALRPWARELDLLHRRDGRPWEDVDATLAWLFGANQRREATFVVLSPKALRAKWDRVQLARARDDGRPAAARLRHAGSAKGRTPRMPRWDRGGGPDR